MATTLVAAGVLLRRIVEGENLATVVMVIAFKTDAFTSGEESELAEAVALLVRSSLPLRVAGSWHSMQW